RAPMILQVLNDFNQEDDVETGVLVRQALQEIDPVVNRNVIPPGTRGLEVGATHKKSLWLDGLQHIAFFAAHIEQRFACCGNVREHFDDAFDEKWGRHAYLKLLS